MNQSRVGAAPFSIPEAFFAASLLPFRPVNQEDKVVPRTSRAAATLASGRDSGFENPVLFHSPGFCSGREGASRRIAQEFRRCVPSQLLFRSGPSFRTSAEVSGRRDKVEPQSSAHSPENTERSSGASELRSGPSARPRTVGGTKRITGSSMNLLSSSHHPIIPSSHLLLELRLDGGLLHNLPHTLSIGGKLNESFSAAGEPGLNSVKPSKKNQ